MPPCSSLFFKRINIIITACFPSQFAGIHVTVNILNFRASCKRNAADATNGFRYVNGLDMRASKECMTANFLYRIPLTIHLETLDNPEHFP